MRFPSSPSWGFFVGLLALSCLPSATAAQSPLHQRIDTTLAAVPNHEKQAAKLASDEEFLRRIYLDLVGVIPTAGEARAFLKNTASDKRVKLIDALLASPEHARHLATVFDVLLMERRPTRAVPAPLFQEYLRESFAAGKPWDRLVREIVSADGTDEKMRAPARFFLERNAEPNLITRDISRLFLGMNLQCAQCHDHPIVEDYKQDFYYGLFAFVNRIYAVPDAKTKVISLGEKAEGEASFQSVFDPAKVTKTTGPRVLRRAVVKEPTFAKGSEYKVKPAQGVRSIPQFSRLAQLGPELARADNLAFKRNFVNRLWAHMMGYGLIHPLDMDHSNNPPSHPTLFQMLCDDALTNKFDMRGLLREFALSKAYQRSSELPPGAGEPSPKSFAFAHLKPLAAEALAASLFQATGMRELERQALGVKGTEAALYARMAPQVAPLIATFGGTPGTAQEFEPTLDQALFLANGTLIRTWLTPRAGNLMDRLSKLEDRALAEEMYLSVLTRTPSAEEIVDLNAYLKTPDKTKVTALQEYLWALLTSAEFRFNH